MGGPTADLLLELLASVRVANYIRLKVMTYLYYDYSNDYSLYTRVLRAMKTVSKSYLKAHMLRLFREVERSGEALVVTDNNTPVLQVVPVESEQTITDTFAGLTGQVTYGRPVDEPTST